jgi:hypothetical protein
MTHEEKDRLEAGNDASTGRDHAPPPEEEYDHDDPADDAPREWEGDPGPSQVSQVHRSEG